MMSKALLLLSAAAASHARALQHALPALLFYMYCSFLLDSSCSFNIVSKMKIH